MINKKELIKKIVARSIVVFVLLLLYFPIVVLIIFSFTPATAMATWEGFSFSLYRDLFTSSNSDIERLRMAILNTFVIAVVSSLIAVLLGTFTAIGMFHLKRRSKSALTAGVNITVINAEVVTGIAFAILFMGLAGGINVMGYWTLIIAHVMFTTPFVILAVLPRLYRLNPNVYEASQDLGAGSVRTLFTVIVPQIIPAMISGFALAFTISLDDFVVSSYVNGAHIETISIWLYDMAIKRSIPAVARALSTLIFLLAFIALIVLYIQNKRSQKAFKKNLLNK